MSIAAILFVSCAAPTIIDPDLAVQDACNQANAEDSYDVTIYAHYDQDGKLSRISKTELRVSGRDFHMVEYDEAGVELGEYIQLGNVIYEKYPMESAWKMGTFVITPDSLTMLDLWFPYNAICPDLTDFNYMGEEMLNGIPVRLFTASGLPDEPSTFMANQDWQLWVNSTGRLIQVAFETRITIEG